MFILVYKSGYAAWPWPEPVHERTETRKGAGPVLRANVGFEHQETYAMN
mgnify:CR=1 FL=1|jgi:hypothetical protein